MANTIDSSLYLTNTQSATSTKASDTLGKDDFLKILMTQLQNQDPLNPMQDKDFIAQMATFTSLEQLTNINSTLESFVGAQQQNQLISFNQFVGKEVEWTKVAEETDVTSTVTEGVGKIVSLQFVNNVATFLLEDGTSLTADNISQVNESTNENQMLQASQLIGKLVTYLNASSEEEQSKVVSVSFKDGKTTFSLENNQTTVGSKIQKIEL